MGKTDPIIFWASSIGVLVVSYFRTLIAVYLLAFITPLYPILQGLTLAGLSAGFGVLFGIHSDPFIIFFYGIMNWIDGEIRWKKNKTNIILIFVNTAIAFLGAFFGGLSIFIVLPGGLSPTLIPQNLTGVDDGLAYLIATLFAIALYHVYIFTTYYSTDGYGGALHKGLASASIGFVLFVVINDVGDYSISFAVGIAAGTFGTDGWIPAAAYLTAHIITMILYYILWKKFASRLGKERTDKETAPNMNALKEAEDVNYNSKGRRGGRLAAI